MKTNTASATAGSYYDYYNQYSAEEAAGHSVTVHADHITGAQHLEKSISTYENLSAGVLSEDNEWCEWDFDIPQTGIYSIRLKYYPLKATGLDIEWGILLDGKAPFHEIDSITLPRTWIDENIIQSNNNGNDIRPAQIEKECWSTRWLEDSNGMYAEPYRFYLEAGTHKLRISVKREAVASGTRQLR